MKREKPEKKKKQEENRVEHPKTVGCGTILRGIAYV